MESWHCRGTVNSPKGKEKTNSHRACRSKGVYLSAYRATGTVFRITADVRELTKNYRASRPSLPKPASLPKHRNARHVLPCISSLGMLLAGGCAVGPNFKTPPAPDVSDYTTHPVQATVATPNTAGGEAQTFAPGKDISADWWTLFHSKPLNDLIDQSLSNNHDLKAARAALSVARENVLAQRGAYYPAVSADFSATRQRQSGQIAPALNSNIFLYNLFTPQVSVSYVPDVFGLNRRTMESMQAQEEGVRFQMIAV